MKFDYSAIARVHWLSQMAVYAYVRTFMVNGSFFSSFLFKCKLQVCTHKLTNFLHANQIGVDPVRVRTSALNSILNAIPCSLVRKWQCQTVIDLCEFAPFQLFNRFICGRAKKNIVNCFGLRRLIRIFFLLNFVWNVSHLW